MAHKETQRTVNHLWWFNFCIVTIIVTLHLSNALASGVKEDTDQNVTAIDNNGTSLNPIAEALIRFRRQPPLTIVKHIIRPKRYKMKRIKRPKIKYSFAEPPTTYYTRKPIIMKKPTFDSSIIEDFSHMNVESADFDLPPSSYDAQSMDLDLYKHYEPSIQAASYKEIHRPSVYKYSEQEISYREPTYTEELKTPSYTYSAPEITFKETNKPSVTYSYTAAKPRMPHTKYGLPTEFHYSSGYDKPNDNKYTLEIQPASKPIYTKVEKPLYNVPANTGYSYKKPASKEVIRIPATTYGVPDAHIPETGSNDYHKYSVVEQKPSYASQPPIKPDPHHFAEPPESEPSVEITYSPSYEINIPSGHENSHHEGEYGVEHYAPAQHPQHPNYDDTNYQDEQYHHPPQNNYESPSQENYEDTVPAHQEVSGSNQPANYQPPPPRHHATDNYNIPASKDLPINVNHKQPPYDYPKSSYEVPIYDPIPFEASNNQEAEIYPPHTLQQSNKHLKEFQTPSNDQSNSRPSTAENVHSTGTPPRPLATVNLPQSPINHLRRTRKRKRNNKGSSTTVSTTKHILDVPELAEAFEKENRKKYTNSPDPDANESQRLENVNNQNHVNDIYNKGSWNPQKIRTSPIILMTTSSPIQTVKTLATKSKRYHYKQQRTTASTTSTTTTEVPTKVEIISIEKSKSNAYYDSALSTPKIYNTNFFRNRFRLENTSTTSTTPQSYMKSTDENNFSKRTTKNIFDTTIFKSPFTDRDVHHNLPKNHKLF